MKNWRENIKIKCWIQFCVRMKFQVMEFLVLQ